VLRLLQSTRPGCRCYVSSHVHHYKFGTDFKSTRRSCRPSHLHRPGSRAIQLSPAGVTADGGRNIQAAGPRTFNNLNPKFRRYLCRFCSAHAALLTGIHNSATATYPLPLTRRRDSVTALQYAQKFQWLPRRERERWERDGVAGVRKRKSSRPLSLVSLPW
jgi:hypothetical protein